MVGLTIRGLATRKLRAGLTGLAVLLGVMMISGTYVFTDTINKAFDGIFEQGNRGVSVVVQSEQAFTVENAPPPAFSESLLRKVKRVAGVALAAGTIEDTATIFLANGDQVKTQGAPALLFSAVPKRFDPLTYDSGGAPSSAAQAAIDKGTADKKHLKVGDMIRLAGKTPARPYKISGIAKYGDIDSLGSATIAVVTLPAAQRLSDKVGELDQIELGAAPNVSPERLAASVEKVVPSNIEVQTGEQNAADQSKEVQNDLSFLRILLLVFGVISLFVGGFIIFNTFSITVAQRTKEFALLRTMGASARQVLGSVMLEALVIGVLASAVGCGAGVLAAKGIDALFKSFGADLPQQGTVVQTRTIVIAMTVGVIVTLASGVFPARRATRVLPLAAIREDVTRSTGNASRRRIVIALVVLVLGFAVVLLGLFGSAGASATLSTLGGGAAMIFVAVAMLSVVIIKPLASAIGKPIEAARGVEGRLARENSVRNPGRTATTAAALMIGVALVTFVTVLAAGVNASVSETLDKNFKAQLVLQDDQGNFNPIPEAVSPAVAKVPGVEVVSPLKFTQADFTSSGAGKTQISGVDPTTIGRLWKLDFKRGSAADLTALQPNQMFLNSDFASDNSLKPGDRVAVESSTGEIRRFKVAGTIEDRSGFFGKAIFTNAAVRSFFAQKQDQIDLLGTAAGAEVGPIQQRVDTLLDKRFPTVASRTQQQFKDEIEKNINQLVQFLYALLSLAVIVSLFGIVNTLVLSISERTRELGMMRAIGTSRRQVRRIVRYEAVITALIGGLLGLLIGLVLGVITTIALSSEGLVVSVPFGSLIVLLVLAAIAGVLAAIPPARRASRIDVLEAIAYE